MTRVQALFLAVGALLLSGCHEDGDGPARIGTNNWLGYEPLYLASELDSLPSELVRLVEFPSTTDVIHALRSGNLDGAALTLDEFISLRADGIDLKVVLVLDISHGADALVARPGIDDLADLRGRRIAYEASAVGAVMLDAALTRAGLSAADVVLHPLTVDRHQNAFKQEEAVDAIVTFDPARSRLLRAGGHILFDSSDIPGRIVDVLAMRGDYLRRGGTQVRALGDGWFAALEQLKHDPEHALSIMSVRQGLTPPELRDALRGLRFGDEALNRRQLAGRRPELADTLHDMARLMVESGLLTERPMLGGALETGALPPS